MRRLVVLLSSIVALDIAFFAALTPLLPHFVSTYGLSKAAAGILSASYAAGCLAAALPSGFVAARYGPRRAALVGWRAGVARGRRSPRAPGGTDRHDDGRGGLRRPDRSRARGDRDGRRRSGDVPRRRRLRRRPGALGRRDPGSAGPAAGGQGAVPARRPPPR